MRKKIIAIVMSVAIGCTFCIKPEAKHVEQFTEILGIVEDVAESYDLCPEMVEALIWYESGFNPKAGNGKCFGLMGISKSANKPRMEALGVTDLHDPYQNILVGCDLLADLFEKYEDAEIVLDSYNRGHPHKEEWYVNHNSFYANRILDMAAELEEEHGKVGGHG